MVSASTLRFRQELVMAARSRFGEPFLHHFKPNDHCQLGEVTLDSCWERGLDSSGYDCSGLVIASICDVLGRGTDDWEWDRRHIRQMITTADAQAIPEHGDVIFTEDPSNPNRKHIGVYTAGTQMIHADGRASSPYVNESQISTASKISVLPLPLIMQYAGVV